LGVRASVKKLPPKPIVGYDNRFRTRQAIFRKKSPIEKLARRWRSQAGWTFLRKRQEDATRAKFGRRERQKLADLAPKRKSWKIWEFLRSPRWSPQAIFGGGASKQDSQMPVKQEREGCPSILAFGLDNRVAKLSASLSKDGKGTKQGKNGEFLRSPQ